MSRWRTRGRAALVAILDAAGLALVIRACVLVSVPLGLAVTGVILLGLAILATPERSVESDDAIGE